MDDVNVQGGEAADHDAGASCDAFSCNPQRQIRVFVSSKCDNDGVFTRMRCKLAREIDKTGVFAAYLWERAGASTTMAEESYRMEVRDSDVCVFILDHAADVPTGVQNEVDEARRDGKKCFFYFVTENGCKELLLKNGLKGAKGLTYKDIEHFSDVPAQVVRDLQEDVFRMYRSWCNGFLVTQDSSQQLALSPSYDSFAGGLPKKGVANLDATTAFFARFLLGAGEEVPPAGGLDRELCNLAKALYEDFSIGEFDPPGLIAAAQGLIPKEYVNVVSARWEANCLYLSGKARAAIAKLDDALAASKEASLTRWFTDDILIDLRNISVEVEGHHFGNKYQEELNGEPASVVYPQIDRCETGLYEKINDDGYKERLKSLNTVTLGDDATRFLREVVKIFAVSSVFGSLTHLSMTIKRMRVVSLYLSEKYETPRLRTTFLKLAIASGKVGNGEAALQTFTVSEFDSDGSVAMDLFRFCAGYRCMGDNSAALFEAFKTVGYYLSDADFLVAQGDFVRAAEELLARKDPWGSKPKALFGAIRSNKARMPVGWAIDFCSKSLKCGCNFWIEQALKFVAGCGDYLLSAAETGVIALVDAISDSLSRNKDVLISSSACAALLTLSKGASGEVALRIGGAAQLLAEQERAEYQLLAGNTASDEAFEQMALRQVELLESANETQGVDGFFTFGVDHAGMLAAYIGRMQVPSLAVARRGFSALIACLRSSNQDIASKVKAAKALERILELFGIEEVDPREELSVLLDEPDSYLSGSSFGENETPFLLGVYMEAISVAIGKSAGDELALSLARCYGEDMFTKAKAGDALRLLVCPRVIGALTPQVSTTVFSYAGFMVSSPHFQLNHRGLELLKGCLLSDRLRGMAASIMGSSYVGQVPRCKYVIIDSVPTIREFAPEVAEDIECMVARDGSRMFAEYLLEVNGRQSCDGKALE